MTGALLQGHEVPERGVLGEVAEHAGMEQVAEHVLAPDQRRPAGDVRAPGQCEAAGHGKMGAPMTRQMNCRMTRRRP